jgi:type I restriction enzyme M protein
MTDLGTVKQLSLNLSDNGNENYFLTFKKLYYHLYTNSTSSRAARIIEDLSKILMCKLSLDRDPSDIVAWYMTGTSNANDTLLPALRERFPSIIEDSDTFSIGDEAVRSSLEILSSIKLNDAPAHILGDAFQALIGPSLRGDKGQFFTPRSVVRAMVEIADPQSIDIVLDPACGTGGFLVETYSYWLSKKGGDFSPIGKPQPQLIGIDKDRDLCRLATALLEIIAPGKYIIKNMNSLDLNALRQNSVLSEDFQANIVLTNPPFGAKIGVTQPSILKQYKLGKYWNFISSDKKWVSTNRSRTSQDPQILFIELCVQLLKPGGILGIILPEGVFGNRNGGYVWDFLRDHGEVHALIDCPRTTFQPGTDTKTNILFFRKSEGSKITQNSKPVVPLAVALTCGHDRRGRTTTENRAKYPDDFPLIASSFKDKENSDIWSICEITNPYYWVPRYYDATTDKLLQIESAKLDASIATFGDLIKAGYLVVGKGNEVGAEAYGTGDIPFIRTSDISNWEVSIDPTKSVSESVYKKYASRQKLKPNDILLVVDGRYRIGRTAILQSHNVRSVVQSHLFIISVTKQAPFGAYEFLYMMNSPIVLRQMRNLTFIQSTLGSIGKRLNRLRIPIPKQTSEWVEKINNFEDLIRKRALILSHLQEIQTPEPEL